MILFSYYCNTAATATAILLLLAAAACLSFVLLHPALLSGGSSSGGVRWIFFSVLRCVAEDLFGFRCIMQNLPLWCLTLALSELLLL